MFYLHINTTIPPRWFDTSEGDCLWPVFPSGFPQPQLYMNQERVMTAHFEYLLYPADDIINHTETSIRYRINTLRLRQNDRRFRDDIFKWIFLNKNV